MKIREKYNACKQRFKNLSLKKKLLLFYTALFLLPLLLISIIIYVEVSQSMTEKIQFSATQGYEQAKSYLEYKILEMIQRTDVVVTNNSPVSYTHLDVYKRQAICTADGRMGL